jgi:hypothetical protein
MRMNRIQFQPWLSMLALQGLPPPDNIVGRHIYAGKQDFLKSMAHSSQGMPAMAEREARYKLGEKVQVDDAYLGGERRRLWIERILVCSLDRCRVRWPDLLEGRYLGRMCAGTRDYWSPPSERGARTVMGQYNIEQPEGAFQVPIMPSDLGSIQVIISELLNIASIVALIWRPSMSGYSTRPH